MARCYLVVGIDEKRNEITLGRHLFLLGHVHSFQICRVSLVIGKHINYVRDRDLKDNVHTALKVESETNLGLKTLLVRINSQILDRVEVVLSRNRVFNLRSLTVVVACGYREGQIEDACQCQ